MVAPRLVSCPSLIVDFDSASFVLWVPPVLRVFVNKTIGIGDTCVYTSEDVTRPDDGARGTAPPPFSF